jgi:hypothetical protein
MTTTTTTRFLTWPALFVLTCVGDADDQHEIVQWKEEGLKALRRGQIWDIPKYIEYMFELAFDSIKVCCYSIHHPPCCCWACAILTCSCAYLCCLCSIGSAIGCTPRLSNPT